MIVLMGIGAKVDEAFLEELAQDMRDNGVDDEIFISETIREIKENNNAEEKDN